MLCQRGENALLKGNGRPLPKEKSHDPKKAVSLPKRKNLLSEREQSLQQKGNSALFKKNNRSVIEKQLPHHRKRAASPPKNSCLTTEKQTFNRWQTDIASMANHHLNEEKPSTKVSQSLLLGDNFLSPERKKFFTYTTQSETIEKGINTSPSTGFFHWILLINLSDSIFKIRLRMYRFLQKLRFNIQG